MLLRFFNPTALIATTLVVIACSDPSAESGRPGTGSGGVGAQAGIGGTAGVAGAASGAGGVGAGGVGAAGAAGSASGAGGTVAGAGGSIAGSAGLGGVAGAAGSTTGGSGGAGGAGGSGALPCPTDATFCADFESSALPDGAIYNRNGAPAEFTTDFVIDDMTFARGAGALRVKTTTEEASSAYKMLAVPTPGPVFWVRAYIRANAELGQGTISSSEHNRFLVAADGSETNTTVALEVAEDCGIALNSHDTVYRPEGAGSTCDMPLRLPPDTWYCLEASFNGNTGDTQVYIDGVLAIDAVAWPSGMGAFTHLKFGVDHLHPIERQVWYDDVAVGPARLGCL